MALYVDIEPVIKRLTAFCVTDDLMGMGVQTGINHAIEILAEARIVEAEPVVHAHWIVPDENYPDTCSNCLFEFVWDGDENYHPKRCPECGAHMDEEVSRMNDDLLSTRWYAPGTAGESKRIYDSDEIMVDYRDGMLRISQFVDGHWVDEHFVELTPDMMGKEVAE